VYKENGFKLITIFNLEKPLDEKKNVKVEKISSKK
jgi:hypothetical protein